MKDSLPLVLLILIVLIGCSSIEHVTKQDLLNVRDTTFLDYPYLRGAEMLESLIEHYPFELPHFNGELNKEGVVRVFVRVGPSGQLDKIKIIESVDSYSDSLALSYLKSASYVAPKNITNIEGPYVLEVLFPFYNSKITKDSFNEIMSRDVVVKYDEPPEPEGGFGAIMKAVQYPELARKHRIEGTSIIQLMVDQSGNTGRYIIVQPMGYGLDDAAIRALRDIKWVPANHDGKPIPIRITVPVVFRLK